jgi:hypothetical protein
MRWNCNQNHKTEFPRPGLKFRYDVQPQMAQNEERRSLQGYMKEKFVVEKKVVETIRTVA